MTFSDSACEYAQGHKVPPTLRATTDQKAVVEHGELLLMVIPTPFVASTMTTIKDELRADQIVVSCTKGEAMRLHSCCCEG